MRKIMALSAFLAFAPAALAEERATTKEAELMVHNAVAFHKREGKAKAFAVFNDPKGDFAYRDLYVAVVSLDGTNVVHPIKKDRIGKKFQNLSATEFKELFKQILAQGKGWAEYKYSNPATGKVEQKVVYGEVVDGAIIYCGAYRP